MLVAEVKTTNPTQARRPAIYQDTSPEGDSSVQLDGLRSHIRETPSPIAANKETSPCITALPRRIAPFRRCPPYKESSVRGSY